MNIGDMIYVQRIDTFNVSLVSEDEQIGLGIHDYNAFLKLFIKMVHKTLGNNVLSMILFGSASRGDARGSSDLNIFVIYDEEKISRVEINESFITIIQNVRTTKAYIALTRRNIYPEVYPFFVSKANLSDTLWVIFDTTTQGIVLTDTKYTGEKLLSTVADKIRHLGGKKVTLPNGTWYWVLYKDFTQARGVLPI